MRNWPRTSDYFWPVPLFLTGAVVPWLIGDEHKTLDRNQNPINSVWYCQSLNDLNGEVNMIKKILVPLDGSGHSKKALELACDLAQKYEAELYLLHVVLTGESKHTLVLGGASVTIDASREEIEEAGRKVMDAAKQIAADHGCEEVHTDIVVGPVAQSILNSAKDKNVDMIVMGSRGLTDIVGLGIGSVSHKVGHLAQCRCVTVR